MVDWLVFCKYEAPTSPADHHTGALPDIIRKGDFWENITTTNLSKVVGDKSPLSPFVPPGFS